MEEAILTAKGTTGQVNLYNNRIEIYRKGFVSFLNHGFDGTKIIFLSKITGLQFKESGKLTAGFIQFIFNGSNESKAGLFDATKDENSITFTKDEQENFEKIRDYIISKAQ